MQNERLNLIINKKIEEGQEQEEIERLRNICWYQQQKILELQKRLSKYESFNQWENVEYFRDWSDRSEIMSNMISSTCKSIMDLGCGEGHIRKYIDSSIQYYGVDYVERDNDTIICDLAIGEFPDIKVDTIFIAGVLEYLNNWEYVLSECCGHCKQVVLSYSTTEKYQDRNPIFVNNLSEEQIIQAMNNNGFELITKCDLPYKSVGFNFTIHNR